MKIELVEKHSMKLKELEKIFIPNSINTELLLQTFRAQENRKILASSRAYQFLPEKKKEEKPKFNLLHVKGKELPHNNEPSGIRVNHKYVKHVRQALSRPMSQII